MERKTPDDQYSEDETRRRRDKALKRALKMPPKPHKLAQSDKKPGWAVDSPVVTSCPRCAEAGVGDRRQADRNK